jgi:hypothetical protein
MLLIKICYNKWNGIANGISWPSLKPDEDMGIATTFGVQGGTGSLLVIIV